MNAGKRKWITRIFQLRIRVQFYKTDKNDLSILQKSSFMTLFLKFWAAVSCSEQFLFRGLVRNGIPRVCFYICSTERNSELFSLPLKGSEKNSETLISFWFHGKEFRDFDSVFVQRNGILSSFLFRGRVRNGIPRFSVPRNSRNSVGNNHLFRLFRLPRNHFFVGNSQP